MTKLIPSSEVVLDPASYRDPQGRLFQWKGQLFRGIREPKGAFFERLLSDPKFAWLWQDGRLVGTTLSEHESEDFELLLEHHQVPFRSYPPEWPATLLRDAALLHLELAEQLCAQGLSLQDASPWNVQVDRGRPLLVDVTSLRPQSEEDPYLWTAYGQFCNFFLHPLYLYACGHHAVARSGLLSYSRGVEAEVCAKLLGVGDKWKLPGGWSRLELPVRMARLWNGSNTRLGEMTKEAAKGVDLSKGRQRLFGGLLKDLRKLHPAKSKGTWSDYAGDPQKLELVGQLIERYQPQSVVDLGCNQGDFALAAARTGARVVALDREESCLDALYEKGKSEKLDLLPLSVDLLNPTPPFGWALGECPSLVDRLEGEMVLALALIHHLCLGDGQPFERVVSLFAKWTKRCLILEFVPPDDAKAVEITRPGQDRSWYRFDLLRECLNARFSKVETLDSYPQGRKLLVCEK